MSWTSALSRPNALPRSRVSNLTEKQFAVMVRLLEGKKVKEIAKELLMTEMAVTFHLRRTKQKLGCRTVPQAAVEFYKRSRGHVGS